MMPWPSPTGSWWKTKDSIPENVPGGRAVAITLITVAGNHIVVDIGNGHFAFYAHLKPGSLRVRVGDRVKRGQVLGLVGNSGNSTEPHLHFHISDGLAPGTSTLGSEGIPYALPSFEVIGRCTLTTKIDCARIAPITVRNGMPMQNQYIRFPK
jgi:murein DD-endopeptidase MepM/ murein hydrolase activator NlpD